MKRTEGNVSFCKLTQTGVWSCVHLVSLACVSSETQSAMRFSSYLGHKSVARGERGNWE